MLGTTTFCTGGLLSGYDESVSLNEGGMEMDETSLYLFRRKQADRIKAMHWDGTGYIPLYKQPMEK